MREGGTYGEDGADQEAVEEDIVWAILAVHLCGTERSPNDGSGEEGGRAGAGETSLCLGCANAFDACYLPVEDGHGDNSARDGSNSLCHEQNTRRNLRVMSARVVTLV